MTSTDFFHRDVATPLSAPPSPESFALKLQRAIDSRVRAVHMVNMAAGARRDLLLELPENFSNLNVSNLDLDGIENSPIRSAPGRSATHCELHPDCPQTSLHRPSTSC